MKKLRMENGELKIVEKKVTSLVPTTEGSQLQVEKGNANYANFRGYISVVLCVFFVYLCVTNKNYTENHRGGTELHGVRCCLKFAEFAEFAVEKRRGGNANYALRVKPAMTRGCVFLKFAEFAEFAVEKKKGGISHE